MMDREKVIKGLVRCIEKQDTVINRNHGFNCNACPYIRRCESIGYLIGLPLMRDAFALLKAQEAKVKTKCNTGMTQWYVCTGCDASVNPGDRFCRICGKVLVWDEQEKQNKRAAMMYREYVGT